MLVWLGTGDGGEPYNNLKIKVKIMKIQTSVRVEDVFYHEAKEVFQRFGLTFGDAVNIFLAKVAMGKGIPFDLTLPNEELTSRLDNIEKDNHTQTYKTTDRLFNDLRI